MGHPMWRGGWERDRTRKPSSLTYIKSPLRDALRYAAASSETGIAVPTTAFAASNGARHIRAAARKTTVSPGSHTRYVASYGSPFTGRRCDPSIGLSDARRWRVSCCGPSIMTALPPGLHWGGEVMFGGATGPRSTVSVFEITWE